MKIALVADLHGNMTAVQALEKDLKRRNVDEIWCLGDLVGKGPSSDRTFDWAIQNCSLILRGNWDEGIGQKIFPNDAFYYNQLGEKRMKMLLDFPLEKHLTLSGKRIRLLHGRPVMPSLLFIQDDSTSLYPLFEPDFDIVGYADCHRQGMRTLKGILFNTGSVGNSIGITQVQYVIMEGEPSDPSAALDLLFVNIPYDINAAVQEARHEDQLPYADAFITEITTGVYSRSTIRPKK